jgi:hypothetical protein
MTLTGGFALKAVSIAKSAVHLFSLSPVRHVVDKLHKTKLHFVI